MRPAEPGAPLQVRSSSFCILATANARRELLAVLDVGFSLAEAGQIDRGYTNRDLGIDGAIEFKSYPARSGSFTGRRVR